MSFEGNMCATLDDVKMVALAPSDSDSTEIWLFPPFKILFQLLKMVWNSQQTYEEKKTKEQFQWAPSLFILNVELIWGIDNNLNIVTIFFVFVNLFSPVDIPQQFFELNKKLRWLGYI